MTTLQSSQSSGSYCCATNCFNSKKRHPQLHFFRFPNAPDRCKRWVINCRRKDLEKKSTSYLNANCRICCSHFEPHVFMNDKRDKLVWNAIPTIFSDLPNPSNPTSQKTLQHKPRTRRKKTVLNIPMKTEEKYCIQMPTVDHSYSASPSTKLYQHDNSDINTRTLTDRLQTDNILIIQTGGTIDKGYPKRNNGYSFEIGESAVMKILHRHHLTDSVRFVSVCKKDSQEMTDDDRKILLETCRKSEEKKILITHGTDTMIKTAQYLAGVHCNKIIILTGSFLPETFKDSDAEFNIGFALGALRTMTDENTFIAMNCRIFQHDKVYKDDVSGVFKALDLIK